MNKALCAASTTARWKAASARSYSSAPFAVLVSSARRKRVRISQGEARTAASRATIGSKRQAQLDHLGRAGVLGDAVQRDGPRVAGA